MRKGLGNPGLSQKKKDFFKVYKNIKPKIKSIFINNLVGYHKLFNIKKPKTKKAYKTKPLFQ